MLLKKKFEEFTEIINSFVLFNLRAENGIHYPQGFVGEPRRRLGWFPFDVRNEHANGYGEFLLVVVLAVGQFVQFGFDEVQGRFGFGDETGVELELADLDAGGFALRHHPAQDVPGVVDHYADVAANVDVKR